MVPKPKASAPAASRHTAIDDRSMSPSQRKIPEKLRVFEDLKDCDFCT